MSRKGAGLVIIMVAMIGFIACTESAHAPTMSSFGTSLPLSQPDSLSPPRQVARPTPTLTTEPLPTLTPTEGILVYAKDDDLWVASLDGGETLSPRRIASSEYGVAYAGYTRNASGRIDLYYTSQLTQRTERGIAYGEFGVYRIALGSGAEEELFRFTGRALEHPLSPSGAAVSPNGRYVAYADRRGLVIADLTTAEQHRLLTNGCAEPGNELSCWWYLSSEWSPDGTTLAVVKGLWEDALVVLLDPFASSIVPVEANYGAIGDWSPDSQRLCIWESLGIHGPVLRVYDVTSRASINVLTKLPLPARGPNVPSPDVYGCAWSGGGQLAVGYSKQFEDPAQVAVLDDDVRVVATSDPVEGRFVVVGWLPDGSGVIFNRLDGQAGSQHPIVVAPDQGLKSFPFDADWALGVIPDR